MSWAEYGAWLAAHGIDVLMNLEQLEMLPPLPKHDYGPKRRNLFCRLCKCYVPGKARVEDAECVPGNWQL